MNIVDSSAWLEYFAATKNAGHFSKIIEDAKTLIVPTIILYEVFKKILTEKGEDDALFYISHIMKSGKVVDLDLDIALRAAKLSKDNALPMADSVILATARKYSAVIWTQDADFKKFQGVKYFSKK